MMHISEEDFQRAVRIANDAGKRGKEINIQYMPPESATQDSGNFIVDEYDLTATGEREPEQTIHPSGESVPDPDVEHPLVKSEPSCPTHPVLTS